MVNAGLIQTWSFIVFLASAGLATICAILESWGLCAINVGLAGVNLVLYQVASNSLRDSFRKGGRDVSGLR